ncbi:MAG TPA: Sec-independent protein translocase protein TatB [Bauldia sp.]|nr:Sec-independent protein translocase protein TatB [Bauldia sp.]
MFDIGWTELLVIAVVAIVVIGPKDLPRAMRTVGQWTTKVKRMAGDFQRQFNEAVREAELEDVKKEVTKLGKIDPMADIRKSLAKADTDLKADLKKVDDGIARSLEKPDAVDPAPKTAPPAPAPVAEASTPAPAAVSIESATPVPAGDAKA